MIKTNKLKKINGSILKATDQRLLVSNMHANIKENTDLNV